MGRGVSSGGGQSSLGYLFGSGEAPKPTNNSGEAPKSSNNNADAPQSLGQVASNGPAQKSTADAAPVDVGKQTPAGVPGNTTNNYFRADGQNCGNFLTVWSYSRMNFALN